MSGSGSTPTKRVPAPRRGSKLKEPSASDKLQNFKTQFGNFMSGWISSENVFIAPTRKGETLPKLADLLKNELFVVLEEGESFSTRFLLSVLNKGQKLPCDAFPNQRKTEHAN